MHFHPDINFDLRWLNVLILLYAETHYAFKGIYSRLKKSEAEIVADLPHRTEPGHPIPILLLIKDANLYPVELHQVEITITSEEQSETVTENFNLLRISARFWHRVIEVSPKHEFIGKCKVEVTIEYSVEKKKHQAKSDNYNCSTHAPFDLFISEDKLPKSPGWYFGEFHCHTNYTSDQVEFGAPLDATQKLAQAMGLNFFCATDHSYDLDDEPDDYLKKDPSGKKWQDFQQTVRKLNKANSACLIVPGEEVSAGNGKNRNVHFLILNHPDLLPGDGDSAERWFRTRPNLSIAEILARIGSSAVAFAAHPGVAPPFFEWLLVRRGRWSLQDCSHPGLNGLQIWNGSQTGLSQGISLWIALLLQGRRVYISGGNDAHGNFNRFRQIGLPFFSMRENHHHLFGKVRTGVFPGNDFSLDALLTAFKKGRMIVTDGPFAEIYLTNEQGRSVGTGDAIGGQKFQLQVRCSSTNEFGALAKLQIYLGNPHAREERLLKSVSQFASRYSHNESMAILGESLAYVRVELYSRKEHHTFKCLTNPIWLHAGNRQANAIISD